MNEQNEEGTIHALAKYYLEKSTKLEQDFVLYKLQSESIIGALQAQIEQLSRSSDPSTDGKQRTVKST
jgi:hypothetical protein